jgi:hypothetical protein
MLTIWAITLVIILFTPLSFPPWPSGSFFSVSLIEESAAPDFLRLFIPSNPFYVKLPSDLFQVFVAVDVINSRFGTLLAAMHFATVGLIGTTALVGGLRLSWARLARVALIGSAMLAAVLLGMNAFYTYGVVAPYAKAIGEVKAASAMCLSAPRSRASASAACALWCPPGAGPEEEPLIAVIERSIPPQRREKVFALFEAFGEALPTMPHWYLPLMGVDPASQGSGRGAALLRETLAVCDRDGMPAYLEASSRRSVPLCERFGFRCRGFLQVGSRPPITPMWRPATGLHGL